MHNVNRVATDSAQVTTELRQVEREVDETVTEQASLRG
jgi:hypothetical protein